MPLLTTVLSAHPLFVSRADNNGTSSQQGSLAAASAGITGGYEGNSTSLLIVIAFLLGLSLYNAVELTLLVFATFVRFTGTYFYSLLIATLGVLPYSTGFILKFFKITEGDSKWLAVTLITIGWYAMVTGQSVVLWSRLHLILIGGKAYHILRWTKWMIIANVLLLHVPTTVLTYGCNGNIEVVGFVRAFQVYEKIQMVGFCLQELLLSSIYIYQTLLILRTSSTVSSSTSTRKMLWQLFTINVLIIAMDILLLGFEFANLYILEASFKGVVYSIKLKLEFAVLGKLVLLVKRERNVSTAAAYGEGTHLEMKAGEKKSNGNALNRNRKGSETQSTTPIMPMFAEMQTDSTQGGTTNSTISAAGSMEVPRRTTTSKSVKVSQDAVFEHYEQVLDRGGHV